MPGEHLSRLEKQLQSAWDGGSLGKFPLLRSIRIDAPTGPGIRGIRSLNLEFGYPVTFLSGQNGSGKSTLLALAALAYHGVEGHFPTNARRSAQNGEGGFGYYTFQDFFYRGPGDADVSGVEITWTYTGLPELSIRKRSDKWMHYERRPPRPVEFLGLSRVIPAIEMPTIRNHFGVSATPRVSAISEETRRLLETILGRHYPSAEVLSGARYSLRRSGRGGGYTSFNMGTGEDALISLLARLASIPAGSLVVVEEIESGLHPAAQKRLTQALVELAHHRQLQVIGSTHSYHVLDSLPRQARVLVQSDGADHRVANGPTSQYALSALADSKESELLILCEDDFSAAILRQALPKQVRRRVDIQAIGAKSELAHHARSYLRLVARGRCLVFWDGDVAEAEATRYIQKAADRNPSTGVDERLFWDILPGGSCPEHWALESARAGGLEHAKDLFGLSGSSEALEVLTRCGLCDPHAVTHQLGELTGLPVTEAAGHLVTCAVVAGGAGVDAIVAAVEKRLK